MKSKAKSKTDPVILFFRSDGHRALWAKVLLEGFKADARIKSDHLLSYTGKWPLLIVGGDDRPFYSLGLSAIRAVLGRKTDILYLNCERLVGLRRLTIKQYFVKQVLRAVQIANISRIITLTPVEALPEIAGIAAGYLPDLNFFDITLGISIAPALPLDEIIPFSEHRGRLLVCSIGGQIPQRGVDLLIDAYLSSPDLRLLYCFVLAGRLRDIDSRKISDFKEAGGTVLDMFLSDQVMLSLIQHSTYVSCLFSPDYDQSSGVFGHSIQLRKALIVRDGSILATLGKIIGANMRCIEYSPEALTKALLARGNPLLKDVVSDVPSQALVRLWQNYLAKQHVTPGLGDLTQTDVGRLDRV